MLHKSEQVTFTEWWLLQTCPAGWVGTFQGNSGMDNSSLHCIYIKKSQPQHRLYFKSVSKKQCGTFCLYFSIPSPFVTIIEDGDTPLDLVHPKPHASSIFLTMFIDILMGPPSRNTRTKTNYLLVHVTDAHKSALTSHSRSISTFYMAACVLVIYWE